MSKTLTGNCVGTIGAAGTYAGNGGVGYAYDGQLTNMGTVTGGAGGVGLRGGGAGGIGISLMSACSSTPSVTRSAAARADMAAPPAETAVRASIWTAAPRSPTMA